MVDKIIPASSYSHNKYFRPKMLHYNKIVEYEKDKNFVKDNEIFLVIIPEVSVQSPSNIYIDSYITWTD